MFDFILSILYPKYCIGCNASGSLICPDCFATIEYLDGSFCTNCGKNSYNGLTHPGCATPHSLDGLFPVISYKGIVKKALYQYKYEPYLSSLTSVFAKIMTEGLLQNEAFNQIVSNNKDIIILPIPLHESRERKRGYNQSSLLGKELAKTFGFKFSDKVLLRIKNTKPQFELNKDDRRQNIKGAFKVVAGFKRKLKGRTLFVVDDISTTGATIKECGKILKQAGAKQVFGLVLSHEG